jgi:hypothetical protein
MLDVIIEAPTREEMEEDEYQEEYERSGLNDSGRSEHTGY